MLEKLKEIDQANGSYKGVINKILARNVIICINKEKPASYCCIIGLDS